MARQPLSLWEQEQRKQFNEEVKKYGVQALANIWKIANNAMDVRTKLNANIWLCDKAVGKDFKAFADESVETATNVTINLISQGETYEPNEQDEQEIWNVANESNLLCKDNEIDEDDWGSDVFFSSK